MALKRILAAMITDGTLQRFSVLEPVSYGVCSTSSAQHEPWQLMFQRTSTTQRKTRRSMNNQANWLAAHEHLKRKDDHTASSPKQQASQQAEVLKTAVADVPKPEFPETYHKVGQVTDGYHLVKMKAFAVVEVGGSQFKVTRDDVIFPNKLHGVDINDVVALDRVLLAGSQECTVLGRPYIPNATVLAAVESQFKDAKVYVFKKKPGINYSRSKGHRQQMTALRILDILGVDELNNQPATLPIKFLSEKHQQLASAGASSSQAPSDPNTEAAPA